MAQKKKKRKASKSTLFVIRVAVHIAVYLCVILVLVLGARSAYRMGYAVFASETVSSEPGTDVVVTIANNMSSKDVGELLERKGLIRDSLVFMIRARLNNYRIYAGTYVLNTSQTIDEMVELMAQERVETESSDAEDAGE